VPIRVYDQTIQVLKSAVRKAKLGRAEELDALKRLDDQARRLESHAAGLSLETLIAQERADSHVYGGRSVFGWERAPDRATAVRQIACKGDIGAQEISSPPVAGRKRR
jgi:hypothetical protein